MSPMKQVQVVVLLLVATAMLAAAPAGAQTLEKLLVPEQTGTIPLYMRGFDDAKTGWTATIFYHPPELVPSKYNLLNGDDPNVDPNCPMFMEGFTLWEEGAPEPLQEVLDIVPGKLVPIYFVERSEMYAAIADGKQTINELEKMDSLLVGWADSYREEFNFKGSFQIHISASGTLEDGRRFSVHCELNAGNYVVSVSFFE